MTVALAGSPLAIGDLWGAINAAVIRTDFESFLDDWRKKDLSTDDLLRLAARGNQIIERMAPYWREESDAIAKQADLDPELYSSYLVGKYRGILSEECTSYAAVGEATSDGHTLFHKNRDNIDRRQAGYIKKTKVPREQIFAFIATSDVSDTGVMMMVNERGLAGSADTGAEDADWFGQGLMNPYGLRYIAEHAETCEQALDIVMWMTRDKLYAGGARQTNWLFADASGMALRIVNSNETIVDHRFVRSGILLNVERDGLRTLLERNAGKIDGALMRKAARLPSVSVQSTICALTAEIDREQPAKDTCAWIALGRPSAAPFVPALMAATETPQEMMDGMLYHLAHTRRGTPRRFASIERDSARAVGKLAHDTGRTADRANELFIAHAAAARRVLDTAPIAPQTP